MAAMIPASMPTVSPKRDINRCFADARRLSVGTHGRRRVVIIAPDGTLVNVPVPQEGEADQSLVRDVRAALSPENEPVTGLAITAINCTVGIQRRSHSFHQLLPLVPNLSYLVGAAYLGNTVVSFEGSTDAFAAGCETADMLIIDDAMLRFLRPDWAAIAAKMLRQARILIFGRDGRLSRLTRLVEVEKPGR